MTPDFVCVRARVLLMNLKSMSTTYPTYSKKPHYTLSLTADTHSHTHKIGGFVL